jgi:hypothetical protein
LSDAVGSAAEDDDFLFGGGDGFVFGVAHGGCFINY